jgi:hypothetical protein
MICSESPGTFAVGPKLRVVETAKEEETPAEVAEAEEEEDEAGAEEEA